MQEKQRTSVRSVNQPNVAGVRTVQSNATSEYKYMTVRIGKRNIILRVDMGAKVFILEKAFYFDIKPRPHISTSLMKLHT